jgi:hypothetical protein
LSRNAPDSTQGLVHPQRPRHPSTSIPLPSAGCSHRRTGKIARLPQRIRERINTLLSDGVSYADIISQLAAAGHQLNADNLSRWNAGGYQEWLNQQAWLEEMRGRLDFATDIVRQTNGDLLDAASLRIAVTQMYTLLIEFNPSILKTQIATQPGAYSRILNALCKLTEAGLKCERHRLDHGAKTAPFQPSPPGPTTGALPSALAFASPPQPAPTRAK